MADVDFAPILTACAAFAWTMLGVGLTRCEPRRLRLAGRSLILAAAALFTEAAMPSGTALPLAALLCAVGLARLCAEAGARSTQASPEAAGRAPAPVVAPLTSATALPPTAAMRDLRNPLTSMLAAIDAAESREHQTAGLQQLRAYGRQLASSMADIEDLQDLLHDELELAHDTYDLRQVLAKCIDEMTPLAREREVQLRFDPSPSLPRWVVGDPSRVRQLISRVLQIATNRCTIGPVDISASADDDRLHLALLNVHAGFEDPDGLGVALASGLAKVMGGTLQLTTRPDGGTEFHVALPNEAAPAWEVELMEAELQPDADASLREHRVQGDVLLMTDQQDHQQLFSTLLHDIGAETTVAATAELALHLLDERTFDLVLLDMDADAQRGPQTMREVRERTADTPVLGLTSDRSTARQEQCLAAGCNGVLHKPVDAELLRGALSMHLAVADRAPAD